MAEQRSAVSRGARVVSNTNLAPLFFYPYAIISQSHFSFYYRSKGSFLNNQHDYLGLRPFMADPKD